MKWKFLFIFLLAATQANAQCEAILPFSESAMKDIRDVYQFQFLHKKPQNKLDTLVYQIMHPAMVIDSNYYDWNMLYPQVRHVVDRIKMTGLVNDIGALRSQDAFVLLSLSSMIPFKVQDDMNPFTEFCYTVTNYGGNVALNKYFLDSAVSTNLSYTEFNNAVILKSKPLRSAMFKGITYCKPLEGDAHIMYEMSKVDPKPYDDAVEAIFAKYMNKHPTMNNYFSIDSITMEVYQLPFFVDAIWDNCILLVDQLDGVKRLKLGVIFKVGTSEPSYIQRVYSINNSLERGQELVGKVFHPNFVSQIRQECEAHDE